MALILHNPIVPLVEGAAALEPLSLAGVAGTGNGIKVPICGYRKLLFVIENTAASELTVTFAAATSGTGSTKGDLVIPVAAGDTVAVIVDTSLHAQDSQEVNVEFATGMTGTVTVTAVV